MKLHDYVIPHAFAAVSAMCVGVYASSGVLASGVYAGLAGVLYAVHSDRIVHNCKGVPR